MVNAKFRNYTANVYTFSTQRVKGSLVEVRTALYTGIKIALWGTSRSYGSTPLGVQTDQNVFEANLSASHPVSIGDVFDINGKTYKTEKVVEHCDFRGKLDNYQVFLSITD